MLIVHSIKQWGITTIMNRGTMVIWGIIIFIMWGIILLIAYNKRDKVYLSLTADLKDVAIRYINKKNIDLKFNESYKIYISDLEESNYINDDTKIKEYCIDSIVVKKNIIKYSYEFNMKCKDEE